MHDKEDGCFASQHAHCWTHTETQAHKHTCVCTRTHTQVEDMMKRSFSEWRAQRSAPEAAARLTEVDAKLARMATLPWPHTYLGCT